MIKCKLDFGVGAVVVEVAGPLTQNVAYSLAHWHIGKLAHSVLSGSFDIS